MILVKTLNDKIVFENKRDIVIYFEEYIQEKGKEWKGNPFLDKTLLNTDFI